MGACAGVESTYVVAGALCAGAGLVGVVAWAARLGAMPICVEARAIYAGLAFARVVTWAESYLVRRCAGWCASYRASFVAGRARARRIVECLCACVIACTPCGRAVVVRGRRVAGRRAAGC